MKFHKILIVGLAAMCMLSGCNRPAEERVNPAGEVVVEDKAERGNSYGNITNYGSAAEYKGDIYCQYGEKGDQLAKISANGEVTVLKETMPYFINIYDKHIYYADANDDFKLHRMKLDGKDDETITSSAAYYVNIVDDFIYYADPTSEYCVLKMGINDDQPIKIISDNCQYLTVTKDKIYYSNYTGTAELTECDINGKNPRIINDMQTMYLNYYNGYIYFSGSTADGDSAMYRQSLETGVPQQLTETASGDINIYNDMVYYTDWDTNQIMVMEPDGGHKTVFDENYGTYINIACGKMFCIRYSEDGSEFTLDIKDIESKEN
ncbi:MAG: DUF5050 domain-containing protein [Firmicutes bacterium]|nr:DUF5050 domain-containing protein [Bacillota bacterium]